MSLSFWGSCWEPEISTNPRVCLWVHTPTLSPDTRTRGYVMVDNGHQKSWRGIRVAAPFPQFYCIRWLFSWVGLGVDACVLAAMDLGARANLQEKPDLIIAHTALGEFQCLRSDFESSA